MLVATHMMAKSPPREEREEEAMAAALAKVMKLEEAVPKTPRQAAMSERLDSYTAERDLFDVVVAGKPPNAANPTSLARQRSSPKPQMSPRPPSTAKEPGSGRQSPVSGAQELTAAGLFSRPDAMPSPLSHKELAAMDDIAKLAAGLATPSRMEQMVRWSANVDLLHGLTRAQRATVIENAEVRVFGEDEEIIRQDSVTIELYIVISGCCSIVLPSIESIHELKYPKDLAGENAVLASGSHVQRAKTSYAHWIQHSEQLSHQKLRVKDLHKDWHKEYQGVLTKKMGNRWLRHTKDTDLQKSRDQHRRLNTGSVSPRERRLHRQALTNVKSMRGQASSRGVYIPGKGFRSVFNGRILISYSRILICYSRILISY